MAWKELNKAIQGLNLDNDLKKLYEVCIKLAGAKKLGAYDLQQALNELPNVGN